MAALKAWEPLVAPRAADDRFAAISAEQPAVGASHLAQKNAGSSVRFFRCVLLVVRAKKEMVGFP